MTTTATHVLTAAALRAHGQQRAAVRKVRLRTLP